LHTASQLKPNTAQKLVQFTAAFQTTKKLGGRLTGMQTTLKK